MSQIAISEATHEHVYHHRQKLEGFCCLSLATHDFGIETEEPVP